MLKDVSQKIPQVIQDHFDALKEHDSKKFISTFASDALLNDVQREFFGVEAIGVWAKEEIFGPNVTAQIKTAFEQNGDFIIRAKVDGDFDKSKLPDPLILSYYFSLKNDRINQLIILRNKKVAEN